MQIYFSFVQYSNVLLFADRGDQDTDTQHTDRPRPAGTQTQDLVAVRQDLMVGKQLLMTT